MIKSIWLVNKYAMPPQYESRLRTIKFAHYLQEMGYKVTVFEKEKRPGGMLVNGIPAFRLEKDVVDAEIDVLRALGVEFKCGVEVGNDITIEEIRSSFDAVVLCPVLLFLLPDEVRINPLHPCPTQLTLAHFL